MSDAAKKRRKPNDFSLKSYITKVLQLVSSETKARGETLDMVHSMIVGLLNNTASNTNIILSEKNSKKTVNIHHLKVSMELTFGYPARDFLRSMFEFVDEALEKMDSPKEEGESKSQSAHAGLIFPAPRISKFFHKQISCFLQKNGKYSPRHRKAGYGVCLAASMQYVCEQLLRAAGDKAISIHKKRIAPRDVFLAIQEDPGLLSIFRNFVTQGGVVPTISTKESNKKAKGSKKTTPAKKVVTKKTDSIKRSVTEKTTSAKKVVAKKAAPKKAVAKKTTSAKKVVAKKAAPKKEVAAKKKPSKKTN
jgi:hypothetical protein